VDIVSAGERQMREAERKREKQRKREREKEGVFDVALITLQVLRVNISQ